jgi:anti-anti-sigma factor
MTTKTKSTASVTHQASRITLGTNPDIAGACKLYERLKKCAAKETDVNLYAANIETIDTASLQLLLSFVRQVRDNGHSVNWKSPSEALLRTARLTGLEAELLLADTTA